MYYAALLLVSCAIVGPIVGHDAEAYFWSAAYLEWYDGQVKASPLPVLQVDCDWILPDAGIIKKSYTVICPSNCLDVNHCERVKGSGPYAVNSPVCMAAIHAGVIEAQTGGAIDVGVIGGFDRYNGSVRNGVVGSAYADYFASFHVQKSEVSCDKEDKKPTPVPCYNTALLDIVFVADSSLSVSKDNFNLEKKFITDLVNHFPIGPHQTRVGLITFNDEPKTRFPLEKYKTLSSLLAAIFRVDYQTGGTYVAKALWEVVKTMKFRENPAVHKIVIVFTDGRSYDSVKRPVKKLTEKGVQMISFGVADIDRSGMFEIADGKEENVFSAKSYDDLKNYVQSLIKRICDMTL